jgi:D-threo-aldose 1-dehydrogenase
MRDFIATDLFEVVLCHNRFTLVDRSAEPLMDDPLRRGLAFVNAAPYGGGILAQGQSPPSSGLSWNRWPSLRITG